MKSYLAVLTLVALLCCAPPFAYGQAAPPATPPPVETVTINKADLTPDQLAKLNTQAQVAQITTNVKTASEWAGAGKEIGIAIKDGLGAASDGVANFAATPPGKLTMFLIAWKVMYKDVFATAQSLTGVVIGIPLLIFADWFLWTIFWRHTRSRRVLVSSESEGFFKKHKKTYEQENTWFTKMSPSEGGPAICVALFLAACCLINLFIIAGVIFHAA